ncbi:MAG TPA: N,N-dimethylformamidase beta subunit family domain-containing protein, partial [Methylomirabilota bacterium]|nr:N,N-dimethylformamidase beta subunit family domain-containing protein [Methylomirabilota bacterium]
LQNPALAHEIEGYAEATSVEPGETLRLHVSSLSPRYSVEVFRTGWYGGAGARQVLEFRGMSGGQRPIPKPRAQDGLIECDWPVSCRVPVGPDWVSGVYLARLTGSRDGKQSFIPFVVREPDHPRGTPHRAPILIQCSVNTWQAYNNWGGKSLYDFNSFGGRASRVSFDRPYASSPDAAPGAGAGEFLTVSHAPHPGAWEYPFLRWIEKEGYDVAYATNVDIHQNPAISARRKALLLVGHDEYWSRAMRDNVERARDRGANLGIFASNVCYWQVRYEPSAYGAADRILFCAKDAGLDPVFNTERDQDLTVRFRNLHPPRPEVSLVGMMMSAEDAEGDFTPVPEARGHWVYDGTGIETGRTRTVPGLLGYEVDRSYAKDAKWGKWSPKGLRVLARSWVQPSQQIARVITESTIYAAPSGALVFAAGTMQWSWGLDDWGSPQLHTPRRHPDVERVTKNLLAKFLGIAPKPDPRSLE